ncbi:MAG: tetratricopeptide repeat protein [Chloroflexota bacterium]
MDTIEELYLIGIHLWQYRHATRRPEPYFAEALRRDPLDSRSNIALGELSLRKGLFQDAERHLRDALLRLTTRNPNPRDGEASYLLGQVLRLKGDLAAADDAFGKASWNEPFQAAADVARAEIASSRGDAAAAMALLERALATNPANPVAQGHRAALSRHAGDRSAASDAVEQMLELDPLDVRAWHERALLQDSAGPLPGGAQSALDIAHDEARAGFHADAIDIIGRALAADPGPGAIPLLHYTTAWLEARRGRDGEAGAARRLARSAAPDYVFPARIEEIAVLEAAEVADRTDARAPYYLGNLLYDRRRYHDAIAAWRRAARLDPGFPTVHRNLGIAEYNVLRRPRKALAAYRRAMRADPTDARVLFELDQLRKRLAHPPAVRLKALEREMPLVEQRDDLSAEYVTLLNRVGRHREAALYLRSRRFHPWEGGEGLVARQWIVAHRESARGCLRDGRARDACEFAKLALNLPENLGEDRHLLSAANESQYLLGRCHAAVGDAAAASQMLGAAALGQGDPSRELDEGPYWQALAARELGRPEEADAMLHQMLQEAREQRRRDVRVPYFATSLPTMLLFDDDLSRRSQLEGRYLEGLALLGLGERTAARALFASVLEEAPARLDADLRLREIDAGEA